MKVRVSHVLFTHLMHLTSYCLHTDSGGGSRVLSVLIESQEAGNRVARLTTTGSAGLRTLHLERVGRSLFRIRLAAIASVTFAALLRMSVGRRKLV